MNFITDQRLASFAVRDAVKRGDLPPARSLSCACGQPAHGYHHSRGYAERYRPTVEPICRKCHHRKPHPRRHVRFFEDGSTDTISVQPRVRATLGEEVAA